MKRLSILGVILLFQNSLQAQKYIDYVNPFIGSAPSKTVLEDGNWQEVFAGTTIGLKRILKLPETTARQIRITLNSLSGPVILSEVGVY